MRRRDFIAALGGAAGFGPTIVIAQQSARPARIGVLVLTDAVGRSMAELLREGLREAGYVEGQNIQFEVRAANGNPIGSGLAKNLARPGGNVTGLTNLGAESAGKCVELFRDMIPSLRRVAVLANPSDPFTGPFTEQVQLAGRMSKVDIGPQAMVRGPDDFENAFATIRNEQAEAVVVQGIFFSKAIADLAIRHRLPTASVVRAFSQAGGLMTYGANVPDLFRRGVVYAQRILQGANPADLPIEQPTKFELVVNLRTARAIGLTISESFLVRADEVIE